MQRTSRDIVLTSGGRPDDGPPSVDPRGRAHPNDWGLNHSLVGEDSRRAFAFEILHREAEAEAVRHRQREKDLDQRAALSASEALNEKRRADELEKKLKALEKREKRRAEAVQQQMASLREAFSHLVSVVEVLTEARRAKAEQTRPPTVDGRGTKMPRSELETEIAHFESELPKLLDAAEGKFALIKGRTVAGIFSTKREALDAGYAQFQDAHFLVREISRTARPVHFSTFPLT